MNSTKPLHLKECVENLYYHHVYIIMRNVVPYIKHSMSYPLSKFIHTLFASSSTNTFTYLLYLSILHRVTITIYNRVQLFSFELYII